MTVLAQVRSVSTRPMKNRRGTLTEVVVGDCSGRMKLVFFNHRHSQLRLNAWGMFAGTVGEYRGEKQFAHPDMHLLDGADDEGASHHHRGAACQVDAVVVEQGQHRLGGGGRERALSGEQPAQAHRIRTVDVLARVDGVAQRG